MYRRIKIAILTLAIALSTLAALSATVKKPVTAKKGLAKATSSNVPAKKAAKKSEQSKPKAKALPMLVDLGADKCIPCKMMFPVLDSLKKEYKGKLTVKFIDVWKNPDAKKGYKINLIPTQILYNSKGKEIFRHEGYYPKDDIVKQFRKHGIKL